MLNKKKIAALIAGAMLGSLAVPTLAVPTAPTYDIDQVAQTLTISGTANPGAEVSINLLRPHKTMAELEVAAEEAATTLGATNRLSEILAYSAQITASSTGDYSVTIDMPVNGHYTAYVDYEGNTDNSPKSVAYSKQSDNITSLGVLLSSNSGNIASNISTEWDNLMFENAMYSTLSEEGVADKLFGLMTETPFTADAAGILPSRTTFNEACIMQAIKEGKADIPANLETFGIVAGTKLADYNTRTNTNLIAAIKENMKNLTFNDKDSYQDALKVATVLAVVRYPDGVSDIMNVITEFNDVVGIVSPSTSASAYTSLAGQNFTTVAQLKKAYDLAQRTNSYVGGNSGSSSGGGFVGGVGDTKIEQPLTGNDGSVFIDLTEAAWAKDAIMALYNKNIVVGMTKDQFCPNQPLTREQFVTMLVKALGLTADDVEIPFSDVQQGDWFYTAVKVAYANNIAAGMGDSFGIGRQITRQDMAVMTLNAIKCANITLPEGEEKAAFTDADEISDYAKDAVTALRNAGIINGMDDGRFSPAGINTRAQAAVVINAILGL